MRVVTESVRGITNWPRDMPLAYMTKVLERLAYDRYIKEWSYIGGKWANLGHFEFKSLDGTDSGRMLEGGPDLRREEPRQGAGDHPEALDGGRGGRVRPP